MLKVILLYSSISPKRRTGSILTRVGFAMFSPIDTDNIEKMIKKAMQERRERLDKKEEQVIQIKPEFGQTLQECVTFSSIHLYFTPSRGER